jgi:hypothetical protein
MFDHHDGDLDMALYRGDGTSLIARGLSATDNERISLAGLDAGVYFVKVYGYLGAANRQYALRIVPPESTAPLTTPPPQAPGPPALMVDSSAVTSQ